MTPIDDRIGIIAGSGSLPMHVAKYLSTVGQKVYVAGLRGVTDPGLDMPEWETVWYDVYSLKELLDGLKRERIKKIVLAGKVGHEEIFRTGEFDDLLGKFLTHLEDRRPATILGSLIGLFSDNGFKVLTLTDVAPDLLPEAGWLAGPPVNPQQIQDVIFGWGIARNIADQDIGQTAVVKNGAVVAVEAMEGTDNAIERAMGISGNGITVVKLAATNHDFKYDVPTIGPDTILKLGRGSGNLIAVEAKRCFMLDFTRISAFCAEAGVTLLSANETEDGGIHWPAA